ncbi:FPGT-like protein [Mya arenaria]|uniref:FPGT-like protein n=1 Tax=Mya arenaria TaxID=6604 RepID=A0ABY7DSM5_MYAAR|nr:fucose-1-phosphate guanylyltransferase-like [Mya arenaria]WAQ99604.1 FPGT-like protein [Mya arenaria]
MSSPTNKNSQIYESYGTIRGKKRDEFGCEFWDLIVLTAMDEAQKEVYDRQLEYKTGRGELPLDVPIHVVADPPGPKIGNGGSTLVSLQFLLEKYGEDLYNKRVLLIHAGGQSQRMPSASVLGKVFAPVPKGEKSMCDMLDMKLAMFCPLIPKMGPGVFVTCADDFLVYSLGDNHEDIQFAPEGFTALAHPSSLDVGTGHGVYVIKDIEKVDPNIPLQNCSCYQVLQKPSIETMYAKGAVLDKEQSKLAGNLVVDGKAAYTDSSFFFAHDVTKKLLQFLEAIGPVKCEIDAYGDFLQALGEGATRDYIDNTGNISTLTQDLKATREKVFDLLRGTPLTLLVMNLSKFVHIGTTQEYINYFCFDAEFQSEMGLGKDVFNLWTENMKVLPLSGGDLGSPTRKKMRLSDTSLGCVMHSSLPLSSYIPETAVVEFCHFGIPVRVGQNCILSNLTYTIKTENDCEDVNAVNAGNQECLEFPPNIFIHTIPVQVDNETQFATVFFHIKDNLKKMEPANDISRLHFHGKTVQEYVKVVNLTGEKVQPKPSDAKSKTNLWFACLFPVTQSPSQSLQLALTCIRALKTDDPKLVSLETTTVVSMAAILKSKDLNAMLKQRNNLYNLIKQ